MKLLEGRRLVIAHNPHSSRALGVQKQVFNRLDEAGYQYEVMEVKQAPLEENVARLAPQIQASDVILSAAGDGSAHAVFNFVLKSNQPGVELGFLAYGNFNDAPHSFNSKKTMTDPVLFLEQAQVQKVWPLTVFINKKPLRSALLYISIGWTARAAQQFDDPTTRNQLAKGTIGLPGSLFRVFRYYLKSRQSGLLPTFSYGGKQYQKTDVICANGPNVAHLFRTGKLEYKKDDVFLLSILDVRSLIANVPFLLSGLAGRMEGEEVSKAEIKFAVPSQVPIQCDGEVVELKDVIRVEVKKTDEPLIVLKTK